MKLYRGVVVNNNSPTKDMRVQVRIFELHGDTDENLSDTDNPVKNNDLPWAEVMHPIDFIGYFDDKKFESSDNNRDTTLKPGTGDKQIGSYEEEDAGYVRTKGKRPGLGMNIHIEIGTWVFCVLDHDNPNMPIVIGTICSHNEKNELSNPLNRVHETVSGHLIEIDDNPGNERLHWHHRTGTDIEIEPTGNYDLFVIKDTSIHTKNNKTEHIDKDSYLTIQQNQNIRVQGNSDDYVKGVRKETTTGDVLETNESNVIIKTTGNINSNTSGSEILKTEGSKTQNVSGSHIIKGSVILLN